MSNANPTPVTAQEALNNLHEKQSIVINAPIAMVWAMIGNFSDLSWVPAVKNTTATDGNNPGSNRTIDFGGAQLTETLVNYDATAYTYSYLIDDSASNQMAVPARGLYATLRGVPAEGGSSVVTWEGSFRRLDPSDQPAAGADDATAQGPISATFSSGLAALRDKLAAQ